MATGSGPSKEVARRVPPAAVWAGHRSRVSNRVQELRSLLLGVSCRTLANGEPHEARNLVVENDHFQVRLDPLPGAHGHPIALNEPHRADLSDLAADEATAEMPICLRPTRAINAGLGAKKVSLHTLCDGSPTHRHLQPFRRFPGENIGSRWFVEERRPLGDGDEIAGRIRLARHSAPDSRSAF